MEVSGFMDPSLSVHSWTFVKINSHVLQTMSPVFVVLALIVFYTLVDVPRLNPFPVQRRGIVGLVTDK